ncbi:MAG: hypothetical protein INQ03_08120 [Candidatus Heimdallarchaeota archaeon]|nr:hypothetical protein [Candidatus Heimdallarchaeota archaeon]
MKRLFIPALLLLILISSGSASVDDTKIGITKGNTFTYKLVEYTSAMPYYLDADATMEVKEGEEFDIEVIHVPDDKDDDLLLELTTTKKLKVSDQMDNFGTYMIYNDWDFWSPDTIDYESIALGSQILGKDEEITHNDTFAEYTLSFMTASSTLSEFYYHIVYNAKDGALHYVNATILTLEDPNDEYSMAVSTHYVLERTNFSEGSALPGFTWAYSLILLPILAIIRKKQK